MFFKSIQHICIHKKNKKSEVSHLSAPRQENKLHDKTSVSRIRLKALNLTKEQPKFTFNNEKLHTVALLVF